MDSNDLTPNLETRPFRAFHSNEKYLYALKENLADWLNRLYDLNLNADNIIEKLETGVILCRHANNVLNQAKKKGNILFDKWLKETLKASELAYLVNAKPKTFQARDNVSKFISWCRCLEIHECLLFETDDLVLTKNEKIFILCLLEVARKSLKFGLEAPLIVENEQEIDRELNFEKKNYKTSLTIADDNNNIQQSVKDLLNQPKPAPQIITNNLKCLHEKVVDLLNKCTCPSQFAMIKVEDGKYQVGNTKVLILVRILRNHVMVRIGGGWDTLGNYLERHDPCRSRTSNRTSVSNHSSTTPRSSTSKTWLNCKSCSKFDSSPLLHTNYDRRNSIGLTESSCSLNSYIDSNDFQSSRFSPYSDESSSSNTSGPYPDSLSSSFKKDLKQINNKNYINLCQTAKSVKKNISTYNGLSRKSTSLTGSCKNLKTS